MCKIILVFFTASVLTFSSQAQQDNSAKQTEVMMKMANLRNALLSKDSVALSNLLADDVTYGHSSGLIQTKPELIRSVMSGEQDYKTIEPSNMNVRIYDNAGVVTTNIKTSLIYQGKPTDLDMAVTLIWVKINGEWKLVARQSVKLPA
ncbi:MAG TPA: nuclear transport factor 2 family protein [Chitinophagaceae bacterium]|nr:nuclear transport factor 2 family protein [Chitinophagaceae bacterium]